MVNHESIKFSRKEKTGCLALALLASSGAVAQVNAQSCDPAEDMFITAQRFDLSERPSHLVVGEFNGDGVDDVAASVDFANSITVQFGDGIDGLLPELLTATGNVSNLSTRSMAKADFNNDGFDDLAIALSHSGFDPSQLVVRLSNGDGTFMPPNRLLLVGRPNTVRTADFNADGAMDIAVTHSFDWDGNPHDEHLTVFMGDGTGGFLPPVVHSTGRDGDRLAGMAVADFDGDGLLDIAATEDFEFGDVTIFKGDGTGGFQVLPQRFSTGNVASFLTSGDLNNDGNQDLVVTNTSFAGDLATRFISVLLGNGDGTFLPNTQFAVGQSPQTIEVADFNDDGNDDLVVANGLGAGSGVSVLLGDGTGSFQDQQVFLVGSNTGSVAVSDINGDGHIDLVAPLASGWTGNGVSIGFGMGDGNFIAPRSIKPGDEPSQVLVSDLNSDGILDLVTRNDENITLGIPPNISVMLGLGNGVYSNAQLNVLPDEAFAMTIEDFNADDAPDVLVAVRDNATSKNLVLLQNNGDGSFATSIFLFAGPVGTGLAAADLNGDGNMDFAIAKSTGDVIAFGLGLGNGDFLFPSSGIQAGDGVFSISARDLNGDGALDLITADALANTVSVHLGNGDATYLPRQAYPVGDQPRDAAVVDLDGDGFLDVVASNAASGDISVLIGNGDGTLQPEQRYNAGVNPWGVTVVDLDGNGIPDLAVPDFDGNNNSWILIGQGDGTFAPAVSISDESVPVQFGASSIAVADLDGDTLDDLVIANKISNTLSILVNQCEGGGDLCAADLTGDGILDLLDIFAFLTAFSAMDPAADFNGDGIFDLIDVSAFVTAFTAGCP